MDSTTMTQARKWFGPTNLPVADIGAVQHVGDTLIIRNKSSGALLDIFTIQSVEGQELLQYLDQAEATTVSGPLVAAGAR